MGQLMLLPINLEEIIPANHLVRVINAFVEQLEMKALKKLYKGGGRPAYHPKMMLKVYLYAYTQKIYSSRRIAKAMRENVGFMWLSGNNRPDFRTINRFRGDTLRGAIEGLFTELLILLVEMGYIKLEEYFIDGTKVEANANRYTFVWAKSNQTYQKKLAEKVKALFEEIEALNQAEDKQYGAHDLEEMGESGQKVDEQKMAERTARANEILEESTTEDGEKDGNEPPADPPQLSETLQAKLEEVKEQLEEEPENKKLAKAARLIESDYLPRAQRYEERERILAGRNSYSKTDPDAIFMRMKEDHLHNSQLKPGYNIQNGTENQFVVNFTIHQEAGDATCLIPHFEKLQQRIERQSEKAIGDAAYGSEENYAYLEQEGVENYLKYNYFHREQKKKYQPNPFQLQNMPYDEQRDSFTCPNQKQLNFHKVEKRTSKNGYPSEYHLYICEDCQDCPLREQCAKKPFKGNRQLRINFPLVQYRRQASQNLRSEEGVRLRSQRGVDVETVFGRIKENWGFRRFSLRGLDKVTVEWGLLCMAHNLSKVWSQQNDIKLVTL